MSGGKDGGPAFPAKRITHYVSDGGTNAEPVYQDSDGMSLRDWFAGQALAQIQGTNPNLPDDPASTRFFPDSYELARRQATWAYLVADAMLAERSK